MTIQQERPLFDQLLRSPCLPVYVQELQADVAGEAKKRQAFYSRNV